MINDRQQQVLTQVEYYLSDANLSNDSFFHQKITDAKQVLNLFNIRAIWK
jgi:flagellar biosynthesis/type III secretory pathway chaperone